MTIVIVLACILIALLALKYPPTTLFFFLLAGVTKGLLQQRFEIFRIVDFTVLSASFVLLAMVYSFIKYRVRLIEILSIPFIIYMLFAVLLVLCWSFTTAPHYGLQKWSRFATLGFISFASPIIFCRTRKDIKLVLTVVLLVGLVITLGTIAEPHLDTPSKKFPGGIFARGTFLIANPLPVAVFIGTASILPFCALILMQVPKWLKGGGFVLLPLMVWAMILTKSRGPFYGMLFIWLVAIFVCNRIVSKSSLPLVIIVVIFAVLFIFTRLPEPVTARIANVAKEEHGVQTAARSRLNLFTWTITRIPRRPVLGHGTGSWAFDWSGEDRREAPHNIILEVLYEEGLVGTCLIILFLWLVVRRYRQAAKLAYQYNFDIQVTAIVNIVALMFFYTLLQAMASFDINENRFMFFCAGFVIATFNVVCREVEALYYEGPFWENLSYEGELGPNEIAALT